MDSILWFMARLWPWSWMNAANRLISFSFKQIKDDDSRIVHLTKHWYGWKVTISNKK